MHSWPVFLAYGIPIAVFAAVVVEIDYIRIVQVNAAIRGISNKLSKDRVGICNYIVQVNA